TIRIGFDFTDLSGTRQLLRSKCAPQISQRPPVPYSRLCGRTDSQLPARTRAVRTAIDDQLRPESYRRFVHKPLSARIDALQGILPAGQGIPIRLDKREVLRSQRRH